MYLRGSYIISEDDPVYPGNPVSLEIKAFTRIKNGDFNNSSIVQIFNHNGTHIDGPEHCNGNTEEKLYYKSIEHFIYEKAVILNLEGRVNKKIYERDVKPFSEKIKNADFLLIRTGFSRYRKIDRNKYTVEYPVFTVGLAHYLVDNFNDLKGVGIDCLSIGSVLYPEEGKKVHRILNGDNTGGKFLLILEDVYVPEDISDIKKLFIIPLFIEGLDSLPVTVFYEF